MDAATKELLELVLKHLTDRIAAAVLLLSGVTLVLSFFVPSIGIWVESHAMWVFFGTAGPICYLATRPMLDRYNEWDERRKEKSKQEKQSDDRHERLKHLTVEEKKILAQFIKNDLRSIQHALNDPVIQALMHEGILYNPPVQPNLHLLRTYNIENWAKDHLKSDPDLLKI